MILSHCTCMDCWTGHGCWKNGKEIYIAHKLGILNIYLEKQLWKNDHHQYLHLHNSFYKLSWWCSQVRSDKWNDFSNNNHHRARRLTTTGCVSASTAALKWENMTRELYLITGPESSQFMQNCKLKQLETLQPLPKKIYNGESKANQPIII